MTARLTIFMGRVSAAVSRAMLALVREPAGALWWPESTPDSLHPCFLGDEADKAIAASRTRPVFVCTHSDPFVLRVRRRIAEGSLAHTDVALVWVEPDGTEKPMALNARAVHDWWPKGVFAEATEEYTAMRRALMAQDEARARSGESVLEALAELPGDVPLHEPTPYSLGAALNVPTDIAREGVRVLVEAGFAEAGTGADSFRITVAGRLHLTTRMPVRAVVIEGSWVRLARGSDWGSEYFALPDKAPPVRVYGEKNKLGIPFKDGMAIRVRWPDGSSTDELVKHETLSAEVSDHGRSSTCRYDLAGFVVSLRGVKRWLPLDEVEVWVGASFPHAPSRAEQPTIPE